MKKVTIKFPQIVIESKEIEVSGYKLEEIMNFCEEERVDFIWENMTEQEQQWTNGKKWIAAAVDADYCGVNE